jgi:predicted N-acetyltransferase YhbS
MDLRLASLSDLQTLSDLCIHSKASWGYSEDFMRDCTEELSFIPSDFEESFILVAEFEGQVCGVAQLSEVFSLPVEFLQRGNSSGILELVKLFIAPGTFGSGVGHKLFFSCVTRAQQLGASDLLIISDPYAQAFYEKMGAEPKGHVLSETWTDRWLPFLNFSLKQA